MKEIPRLQARSGDFGPVDVEAARGRIELLRSSASLGTIDRLAEPRYATNPLPGGSFVTLYTGVTARRQAEERMPQARRWPRSATPASGGGVRIEREVGVGQAVSCFYDALAPSGRDRTTAAMARPEGTAAWHHSILVVDDGLSRDDRRYAIGERNSWRADEHCSGTLRLVDDRLDHVLFLVD